VADLADKTGQFARRAQRAGEGEMTTKIYGTSDDLIELEGDIRGEVGCFGTDDQEHGVLLFCSDATVLEVKYGKNKKAIWEVKVLKRGSLFDRIGVCTDEDADPYSDVAHFRAGLKWAYAAAEWEFVN
jgi:hypothetical protein